MSLPKHLLHIGFPKAGSTFLQEWFSKHPKFHYQFGAFAGYHNLNDFIRDSARLEINQYDYLVTSSESIAVANTYAGLRNTNFSSFDDELFTTNPSSKRNLCEALFNLFPESKVLIVTRGFRSVFRSGYAQYVRVGGVRSAAQLQIPFYTSLKLIADQLNITELDSVFRSIMNGEIYTHYEIDQYPHLEKSIQEIYSNNNDAYWYDRTINLYQQKFGKENVIIMPYELLKADQEKFLHHLQVQLRIEPVKIDIGIVYSSLSSQELFWRRQLSRRVAKIGSLTGEKYKKYLVNAYMDLLIKNKFNFLFRVLKQIFPNKAIEALDLTEEHFNCFRNQANLLKDHPLYQPYLKEYLLDDKS